MTFFVHRCLLSECSRDSETSEFLVSFLTRQSGLSSETSFTNLPFFFLDSFMFGFSKVNVIGSLSPWAVLYFRVYSRKATPSKDSYLCCGHP